MKNIKNTSDLVKDLLIQYPLARNDDDYLYLKVCETMNKHLVDLPFSVVFMHRRECGFPPFESVRRARQKLQSAFPELAGSDEVEAQRAVNESIVRDYARKVNV